MPKSKKCVMDSDTKKCRKSRKPGRPKGSCSRKYKKSTSKCRKYKKSSPKRSRKRRSDYGVPRKCKNTDIKSLDSVSGNMTSLDVTIENSDIPSVSQAAEIQRVINRAEAVLNV